VRASEGEGNTTPATTKAANCGEDKEEDEILGKKCLQFKYRTCAQENNASPS